MRAFNTILRTEMKLVLRHMDSVVFGIGFPLFVAVVVGLIYGTKPAYEGAPYTFMEQSFGAFISIGICATGLMGVPLQVSDYRHRKILKRYWVTPVSPGLILTIQMLPQMMIAFVSALLVYGVSAAFFGYRMVGSWLEIAGAYSLVMVSMYAIGMMIASLSPNMKAANVTCTLVYFPMLFLSGATVPYEVMPAGVQKVMELLPLTQGIKLLKAASLGTEYPGSIFLPLAVIAGLAAVGIAVSVRFFRWE